MKLVNLLVGWLVLWCSAFGGEPRFTSGALDTLACEVVRREESPWGQRLLIEVRNSGAASAEPLTFTIAITPKKKPADVTSVEVSRAELPLVRRYGRAVPPNGKERYWVQIGVPDGGERYQARVTRANWFEGSAGERPELVVGKLVACAIQSNSGARIGATSVHLENKSEHDLDLVFLAEFKEPQDGRALLGVRLRAKSERDWILSRLPAALDFVDEAGGRPTRVTKLECIDWCAVGASDPQAGEQLYRAVDAGWIRWEKPFPSWTGRFRHRAWGDDHRLKVEGTFELDLEGHVRLQLTDVERASGDSRLEPLVQAQFEHLLADVTRPSADEVLASNRVRLLCDETLELDGPGWWRGEKRGWSGSSSGKDGELLANFTLHSGRWVASGTRTGLADYTWRTQLVPGGWVVTERRNALDQWCESYEYGEVDGVVVPLVARTRLGFVDKPGTSHRTLELFDLHRASVAVGAQELPAPQGSGVDALRTAWNNGFRTQREPRTLRARFEARNPATDLTWQGHELVRGTVKLSGYRGFLCDSSGWASYQIEIDGKLPDETRSVLANAVDDRLRLWSGRDFNGRGEFERIFAGATIAAADGDGSFAIEGSNLASVQVRDGRVVAITRRNLGVVRYTWAKFGEAWLVTRTQSGTEDLRAKFSKCADTFVPTSIEMLDVFGKGWGPETITLSDVALE
ncbi:MAG: hypothetical protein IT454_09550 [Planctomycetes bacterium]|nr:hypothetical protein [Planctomycetota bacterium]